MARTEAIVSSTGIGFADTLLRPVGKVLRRVAQAWKARKTYLILAQMDDHQLSDIGLSRGMLYHVEDLADRRSR